MPAPKQATIVEEHLNASNTTIAVLEDGYLESRSNLRSTEGTVDIPKILKLASVLGMLL
jgi:hypothetical protein